MPSRKGGMAAIIGLELDTVESCCADVEGVVRPANINAPDQIVISGDRLSVEEAISRLEVGRRRSSTVRSKWAVSFASNGVGGNRIQ